MYSYCLFGAQLQWYTSVSMGNRFLLEQGIFTDMSSQASLNLLGYETGNSPSLRRSVCKKKENAKEGGKSFTGCCYNCIDYKITSHCVLFTGLTIIKLSY